MQQRPPLVSLEADKQADVLALLSDPATYGSGVKQVEHHETHISHIFLAGPFAYKLKRAVRLPYLDFSGLEKRLEICNREVELNKRTAPEMYLGVVPVTRDAAGRLALDGDGTAVDWLVKMVRFDNTTLFVNLAEQSLLTAPFVDTLAGVIADFHAKSPALTKSLEPERTGGVLDINFSSFRKYHASYLSEQQIKTLDDSARAMLEQQTDLLGKREADGKVRHCHGDLHLGNICLFRGRPTLFDALEFNAELAEIDVFYDLAFLLMDFDHWQLRPLANLLFNQYLDITGDDEGIALLPLFLSMRAAVRAHVGLAKIHNQPEATPQQVEEVQSFFSMALAYLAPPPPQMIAIGGLSGTGKSCLARELAPDRGAAPGARIIRTDATRKRLAGVAMSDRLDEAAYSPEMSALTYETVYEEARCALAAGHSVICDGVFSKPAERQTLERIARSLGVDFRGLWLQAPEALLVERVNQRVNDVSDATADVVKQQLRYKTGPVSWHLVDATGSIGETKSRALRALDQEPSNQEPSG